VISLSEVQFEKHLAPKISTFTGMQIAFNLEPENASLSIRCNELSGSNGTVKCDFQFEKLDGPMISTFFGI
jgi:hypothetical protein